MFKVKPVYALVIIVLCLISFFIFNFQERLKYMEEYCDDYHADDKGKI